MIIDGLYVYIKATYMYTYMYKRDIIAPGAKPERVATNKKRIKRETL